MSEARRISESKLIGATPETDEVDWCVSSDEEYEYPLEDEYYKEDGDISVGEQYSIEEALTEEERKQKLLYICATDTGYSTKILRRGDDYSFKWRNDYPSAMVGNRFYSVAVLHSKIYFIGGFKDDHSQTLNQVSVFDPASSTWSTAPSMNEKRASPAVVTYKNKIYAFGFMNYPTHRDKKIPPGHFSEFYDDTHSSDKKWVYLPSLRLPEEILFIGTSILTHALNEPQGVLYCFFNNYRVYSYTFETRIWSFVPTPGITFTTPRSLQWSASSVFLNNILFWHYFGTIYAYRFSDCKLLRLCTFNSVCNVHPNHPTPYPSYLVNVGNAKLCLVYNSQHFLKYTRNPQPVWYHTFEVRFFRTSVPHVTAVSLVHQGCQSYPHPDAPCWLSSVVAMDRDVDTEAGKGPRDEDRGKGQEREQYCYPSRFEEKTKMASPKGVGAFPEGDPVEARNPAATGMSFNVDPVCAQLAKEQEKKDKEEQEREPERKEATQKFQSAIIISGAVLAVLGPAIAKMVIPLY